MTLTGLADCNSFYASCEKVFRPDLRDKAVVVLSNNDGCIVALSKEAKAAGIKRGVPYYQVKEIIEEKHVEVFSSNYTLYQDLSDRIVACLREKTENVEVYSIDEAFFTLQGPSYEYLEKYICKLARYLKKCVGIPVSVGLARTKTLAKIANHIGKKKDLYFLLRPEKESEILKELPISEIWGIGRRYETKLLRKGITNAYDFSIQDNNWLLKNFTVTGLRTAVELRGRPCIPKEDLQRHSFSSSISFAQPKSTLEDIEEAITKHCTVVSGKLEQNGWVAGSIGVQLLTSRFRDNFVCPFNGVDFKHATSYVPSLAQGAKWAVRKIFEPSLEYKAVRIIVWNVCKVSARQYSLFEPQETKQKLEKQDSVSKTMKKMGLNVASGGQESKMDMAKRNFLSPFYTTRWNNLPIVGKSDKKI